MTIGAIQSGTNAAYGNPRTTMDTYQFLRLLIVELTSQNPMDPVKDPRFSGANGATEHRATDGAHRQYVHHLPSGGADWTRGRSRPADRRDTQRQGGVGADACRRVYLTINGETVPIDTVRTIC
jgi:hypothetical protein